MAMSFVDRVMRGMETGDPWDMARASYAYSRAHGLTVYEAFSGAVELYFIYRKKSQAIATPSGKDGGVG